MKTFFSKIKKLCKKIFTKKVIIISSIILVILIALHFIICSTFNYNKNNDFSKACDANQIEYTTKGKNKINITKNSSWSQDDKFFTEISLDITNINKQALNDWSINISFPKEYDFNIKDGWCGKYSKKSSILTITPESYNTVINPSEKTNIGFIISSKKEIEIERLSVSIDDTIYNK